MNFEEISLKLQANLSPGELSELNLQLAGYYGLNATELDELLARKAESWIKIRSQEGVKSDAQADRLWEQTADGQRERRLKLQQKTIEKLMSAVKTRIQVMTEEARNTY